MAEVVRYPYSGREYDEQQFTAEIVTAGLPAPSGIHGSGYSGPGSRATLVYVGFDAPLNPAQKLSLDAVAATHVAAPLRHPRLSADLIGDIMALLPLDRTKLFAAVAAEFLQRHPGAARALGIAVDGDA